ncbi:hydrogenase [Ramlibacter monticola]|uniref:Hydrogenase n=1 Tax=Ramlibacter monticola TaxID=1926872 RepID=A0A937CW05_9BURK|nr:3-hydroxybutyrate oligomer hydrolase family protein [Ramlibacter monticola]MBL0394906.1 hydrogenase [Ramlibacter monticola]
MLRTTDPAPLRRLVPLCAVAAAVLAACGGGSPSADEGGAATLLSSSSPGKSTLFVQVPGEGRPLEVTQHSVTAYPATAAGSGATAATQDLLTGGIGKTGLGAPLPPAYADAANPTAAELRRNALYSNYRGILDPSAAGGYGKFYGPNVKTDGTVTTDEGLIPGTEYVASLDDGSGRKRVVMAVQIPDSFDTERPCLVLGPSSGSRGVYGAIGTAGEWGLKHGCAVALTDAGKGIGLHDLQNDTVTKVDGTRATRAAAGALAQFAANVGDAALAAFNAALPNRFALKHAHSQQNPEKDWGKDTLAAAQYAFVALEDHFGRRGTRMHFDKSNTLVIAGSASNGGAAVLRAAELDRSGIIDGVVASEPVTEIAGANGFGITVGGVPASGFKTLADYVTYGNLLQPCAAQAPEAAMAELSVFNFMTIAGMNGRAQARCAGLAAKGLVSGATLQAQASDALAKLRAYGWTAEHERMHNAHWGLGNGPILSAMYPLAYGRFSVLDQVCGTSFAAVNPLTGDPIPAPGLAITFATANGTANGTPATPVYDRSPGGSKAWQFAGSASTGVLDFGLDTALCQRALVTGTDPVTGAPLTAASTPTLAQSRAVQAGIAEVLVDGDLRGTPTLVVAGRSDALVPVDNNARAYTALNRASEGRKSQLHYVEVTNAQHFDTFIPLSGFDTRFVPLHVYFNEAMDRMYAHLRNGAALPPSQVVRTTPRGGVPGAAPALTAANVPPISDSPAAGDRIGFSGTTLTVPQ